MRHATLAYMGLAGRSAHWRTLAREWAGVGLLVAFDWMVTR